MAARNANVGQPQTPISDHVNTIFVSVMRCSGAVPVRMCMMVGAGKFLPELLHRRQFHCVGFESPSCEIGREFIKKALAQRRVVGGHPSHHFLAVMFAKFSSQCFLSPLSGLENPFKPPTCSLRIFFAVALVSSTNDRLHRVQVLPASQARLGLSGPRKATFGQSPAYCVIGAMYCFRALRASGSQ